VVELRDVDSWSDRDEVTQALAVVSGIPREDIQIIISPQGLWWLPGGGCGTPGGVGPQTSGERQSEDRTSELQSPPQADPHSLF